MGRSRGEHGDRASTGGFSGTCDLRANFCCWLHTSGTISPTHACLPTTSSAAPSASRGSGPLCGNMVPARRACDLPGSLGDTAMPLFLLLFLFPLQGFFFFPPSLLPAAYAALPPLSTHSSCLDFSFPSTNMCSLGSFSSLPSSPHQCCLPKLLFLLPFSLFSHRPTSFLPLPASLSFPPASRAPVHSLRLPFSDSLGEICLCQHTNSIIYWLSGAGSYTRL